MGTLSSRNQQVKKSAAPLSPGRAGFIQQHGGATAPSGWAVADGSAVSRTDYAQLFSNIGTKYGVGDGSTTFNLPNGPRRTVDIPLTVSNPPTGFSASNMYGQVEQSADGEWYLDFYIDGTATAFTTSSTMSIDGITVSEQQVLNNGTGSSAIATRAFYFSTNTIFINHASSNPGVYVRGRVRLASKPTDAFVAASSFSTFDEALESTPIIKLYDDVASSVSVGIAEATATEAGVVTTSDYYNEFVLTPGIVGDIRTITVTKPGLYLINFSTSWSDPPSDTSRAVSARIVLNSVDIALSQDQLVSTTTSADYGSASAHAVTKLEIGDVLVFNSTSVNANANIYCYSVTISPLPYTSSMTGSIGNIS